MNIKEFAEQSAKNGAEFLDNKSFFDWFRRINKGFLDINSYDDCILGQLYDDYGTGCLILELDGLSIERFSLGFHTDSFARDRDSDEEEKYATYLTEAWINEIDKRLAA